MTCRVDRIPLPGDAPGENRCLTVRRYGTPGARPKVYLQGGLHADELPGPLALHHLSRLLDKADAAGEVLGEIVLVPAANPIGSGQIIQHRHLGRFALSDGGNFNRGFADLAAPAIDRLDLEVLRDEATLAADFRQAMAEVLDGLHPLATVDRLRHTLLGLAFDADIALDLHCDDRSLHHLFVGDDLWPELADLAGLLGIEVVLTSTNSEGLPFEEALSMPWWWLRSRLAERAGEATAPSPLAPLPLGCLSATVELGGQADVDDETAASDAEGLIRFMRHRGALAGDAGELPASGEAYPLEATEVPKAPVGGIVTYPVPLGARVARGDLVAEIVDVTAADQSLARHPVYAGIDGFILSQRLHRQVWPGVSLAKIVGREPIEGRSGAALLQP